MKSIEYKDFKKIPVKPLRVYSSSEAHIYYNNKILYKIYKELTREEAKRKNTKINILSQVKGLNEAVLPIDKIINKKGIYISLVGLTEEFIEGTTLWDLSKDSENFAKYLNALRTASIGLKRIHNRSENIVLGDANFDNIVISEDGRAHFVDFDSVMIDKLKADRISIFYDRFISNFKNDVKVNRNSDRLTFLLYFLNNLFNIDLNELSMYEYDYLGERLNTLRNLRTTVVKLKKTGSAYVPYLHQVIDKNDMYEVEEHRKKMEMR